MSASQATLFDQPAAHDPGGRTRIAVPKDVVSTARFSGCQRYRYYLERMWGGSAFDPGVVWIMMNPSTADHQTDDPTVAKCRRYAARWGFTRMTVLNIMAYRSTSPKGLLSVADPVGPENHDTIRRVISEEGSMVVCAWGNIRSISPKLVQYEDAVVELMRDIGRPVHVLRLNQAGRPWHPLYIPDATTPTPWEIP